LEELAYFKPNDIDTSAFSKLYKLVYDEKLNYDKDGIKAIYYKTKNEIMELIKKDITKFKEDYPKIFVWLDKNGII